MRRSLHFAMTSTGKDPRRDQAVRGATVGSLEQRLGARTCYPSASLPAQVSRRGRVARRRRRGRERSSRASPPEPPPLFWPFVTISICFAGLESSSDGRDVWAAASERNRARSTACFVDPPRFASHRAAWAIVGSCPGWFSVCFARRRFMRLVFRKGTHCGIALFAQGDQSA